MKVITLLNEKGGVGKTTLATHIAAGLALSGYRVILVDADAQGNATSALSIPKAPMLYNLLVRGNAWRDCVVEVNPEIYNFAGQTNGGRLFCVSSNTETISIAMHIKNTTLRKRLAELQASFDYVVFDTAPTPSLFQEAVAIASDYIIVPTELESFSALEGLPDSLLHLENARNAMAERGVDVSRVIGIIPNRTRDTQMHKNILAHLHDNYGDLVWSPIKQAVIYSEVQAARRLLYALAPDSKATQAMWNLVQRVIAISLEA